MATSYTNSGGSGNRTALITVTATGASASNGSALVNGSTTDTTWWLNTGTSSTIEFLFLSKKIIDEATFYQQTGFAQGTWQWEGSNDHTAWTNIGSTFAIVAGTQTLTSMAGNTTGYSYYRMRLVSGSTSNGPYVHEVEFKIDDDPSPAASLRVSQLVVETLSTQEPTPAIRVSQVVTEVLSPTPPAVGVRVSQVVVEVLTRTVPPRGAGISVLATTSKAGAFSTSTVTDPIDTLGIETLPVGDGVTSRFVLVHNPNLAPGYVTSNGVNETLNRTGDTDAATWTYDLTTNSLTRNPLHPNGSTAGPPAVGVITTIGYEATLIEVSAAYSPSNPTVTDNAGNTWTPLTEYLNGGRVRKWFAYSTGKCRTGHIFTVTGSGTLVGAVSVRAYSGNNLTCMSENGATASSATAINGGAVLAPGGQALVTASLGSSATPNFGTVSITGGTLAIFAAINHVSGVTFGLHSADEIQTVPNTRNPAWSWTTAGSAFAATAVYYEATGSPTTPPVGATRLYLCLTPISMTLPAYQGTWDVTSGGGNGGPATILLSPDKNDSTTNSYLNCYFQNNNTAGRRMPFFRGVSRPLAAQTISGTIGGIIGLGQNSGGTPAIVDAHLYLHIYVAAGTSGTVRGTLLANYGEPSGVNNIPNPDSGVAFAGIPLTSLAVSAGDFMVIEWGIIVRAANSVFVGGEAGTKLTTGALMPDLALRGVPTTSAGYFDFSTVITDIPSPVRVSQAGVELAYQSLPGPVRIAQAGVELLYAPLGPPVRIAQAGVELVYVGPLAPKADQAAVWMGDGGGKVWIE